jgi:4-alpha-glucanotransferase
VVYTGTHDNDTTAGWYEKLPGQQREALKKKLGTNDQGIVWAMIREALASQGDTAIVPAQDLLELGSKARMNLPGIAKGNWGWRLKDGALTQKVAQTLRSMTIETGRVKGRESSTVPRSQEEDLTPQITRRAFEFYEQRGRQNGQTVKDWLQAEQEIKLEAIR